jgi:hypothetical protein
MTKFGLSSPEVPSLAFASWTITILLLLLQEDQRLMSMDDPEAQFIAEVIALR